MDRDMKNRHQNQYLNLFQIRNKHWLEKQMKQTALPENGKLILPTLAQ